MSKENTIVARRLPDGTLVQVLPDGTTRPFPADETEAQEKEAEARLEALLLEGLASESIPLDEEFWRRFKAKTAKIRQKYASRPKTKLP